MHGQIGIGTSAPNSSSKLDLSSTQKGFMMPKMTTTQMEAINSPDTGLLVFNTTTNTMHSFNGRVWISDKKYKGGFADGGVSIELGNIKIRMASLNSASTNSMQIATVSGTISASGSSLNNFVTNPTTSPGGGSARSSYTNPSKTIGTNFTHWQLIDFEYHGSTQEVWLFDETNLRAYRLKMTVGGGYRNNFLEIEQLY
jgi:hypothetical protein